MFRNKGVLVKNFYVSLPDQEGWRDVVVNWIKVGRAAKVVLLGEQAYAVELINGKTATFDSFFQMKEQIGTIL